MFIYLFKMFYFMLIDVSLLWILIVINSQLITGVQTKTPWTSKYYMFFDEIQLQYK